MGDAAAASRAELFALAAAAIEPKLAFAATERLAAFFVPGRIEVLGKHTDYAGGRTMVTAVERGFALLSAPRSDDCVELIDACRGESVAFRIDPELTARAGHWSNYPMTVARRMARNSSARRGATIALASDLPPAAGMSSSSAFMVACFLALDAANQVSGEPAFQREIQSLTDLAGYLAAIENGQSFASLAGDRGVGTCGGGEDHTAILCARPGRICQYGYCPVCFQRAMALPPGYIFAVGVTGVAAEKSGAAMEKYNRASRLASAIVERWRRTTGADHQHLAQALASSADAAGRLAQIVAQAGRRSFRRRRAHGPAGTFLHRKRATRAVGRRRARHGDLKAFGDCVERSQRAGELLLRNQVPETIFLAAIARKRAPWRPRPLAAALAAAFRALVESQQAEEFLAAWGKMYRLQFPASAAASLFFTTAAGPAAFQLG